MQLDLNLDGSIDGNDLRMIVTRLGTTLGDSNYLPSADVNGDGSIDQLDIDLIKPFIGCLSQPAFS